MSRILKSALALGLVFTATVSSAQDYPYEESTPDEAAVPAPKKNHAAAASGDLDVETPAPRRGPIPSLFRIGLKVGAEYSVFQPITGNVTDVTTTGFGFDGLVSFGWDLAYQPIFFEFETGYRGILVSSGETLNIIPLRFGVFRRVRTGAHSLFKFGIIPSMDLRLVDNATSGIEFSALPSLGVGMVWESRSFLVQPEVDLYRFGSNANFISFAFLVGFRF